MRLPQWDVASICHGESIIYCNAYELVRDVNIYIS